MRILSKNLFFIFFFVLGCAFAFPQKVSADYEVRSVILIPRDWQQKITPDRLNQYKSAINQGMQSVQSLYSNLLNGHSFKFSTDIEIENTSLSSQDINTSKIITANSPRALLSNEDAQKVFGKNFPNRTKDKVYVYWVVGTPSGGAAALIDGKLAFMRHQNILSLEDATTTEETKVSLVYLAHELGHTFGAVTEGWADGHPCTERFPETCKPNTPKPYASATEWESIMGYGTPIANYPNLFFNNSDYNPEIWQLYESPFLNPNRDQAPQVTKSHPDQNTNQPNPQTTPPTGDNPPAQNSQGSEQKLIAPEEVKIGEKFEIKLPPGTSKLSKDDFVHSELSNPDDTAHFGINWGFSIKTDTTEAQSMLIVVSSIEPKSSVTRLIFKGKTKDGTIYTSTPFNVIDKNAGSPKTEGKLTIKKVTFNATCGPEGEDKVAEGAQILIYEDIPPHQSYTLTAGQEGNTLTLQSVLFVTARQWRGVDADKIEGSLTGTTSNNSIQLKLKDGQLYYYNDKTNESYNINVSAHYPTCPAVNTGSKKITEAKITVNDRTVEIKDLQKSVDFALDDPKECGTPHGYQLILDLKYSDGTTEKKSYRINYEPTVDSCKITPPGGTGPGGNTGTTGTNCPAEGYNVTSCTGRCASAGCPSGQMEATVKYCSSLQTQSICVPQAKCENKTCTDTSQNNQPVNKPGTNQPAMCNFSTTCADGAVISCRKGEIINNKCTFVSGLSECDSCPAPKQQKTCDGQAPGSYKLECTGCQDGKGVGHSRQCGFDGNWGNWGNTYQDPSCNWKCPAQGSQPKPGDRCSGYPQFCTKPDGSTGQQYCSPGIIQSGGSCGYNGDIASTSCSTCQ